MVKIADGLNVGSERKRQHLRMIGRFWHKKVEEQEAESLFQKM